MRPKLVRERRDQPDKTPRFGDSSASVMMTPPIDEDYWTYRVIVSDDPYQAIVGFPKFDTMGIGFAIEGDWNTNLSYTTPAADIVEHIWHNRLPADLDRDIATRAVLLIQEAAIKDRTVAAAIELAADMRRWAAVSEAVMLPADVVDQWADAIDALTEDNEALRKATRLHGVSGPLLQAVVSDRPERCMYCDQPAEQFTITCTAHGSRPTTSLGDKLRAQMEHTIPGSDAASMLERLAGETDDQAEDTRRREGTWQRLYTSMKRQRNQFRERLNRD